MWNIDANLNIPVLALNGEHDRIFCGVVSGTDRTSSEGLAAAERPWYGPGATVEGHVVRGGGHDVALERTAPEASAAMLSFVAQQVGAGEGVRGSKPGVRPAIPVDDHRPVPLPAAAAGRAFSTLSCPWRTSSPPRSTRSVSTRASRLPRSAG